MVKGSSSCVLGGMGGELLEKEKENKGKKCFERFFEVLIIFIAPLRIHVINDVF